jgi:hypothetical protein
MLVEVFAQARCPAHVVHSTPMGQDSHRALRALADVELPQDLELVLGLQQPDPEHLETLGEAVLGPLVSHLATTLAELRDPEQWARVVATEGSSAARAGRAGRILVAYFARCSFRLLAVEGSERFDKRLDPLRAPREDDDATDAPATSAEQRRFLFLVSMCLAVMHILMARTHATASGVSPEIEQRLDLVAVALAVVLLDDSRLRKGDRGIGASGHVAIASLAFLHREMERTLSSTDWYGKGPFSSIRLSELQAIACRDEAVLKRYGERNVAQVFEHQLALIAQSFGFLVVQTRTGTRRVDLVCISPDPTDPYTVLIEAKSTRKPYALPTDDQRALKEYVEEVRRTLVTLPSLRLVLLVGPSAASTLDRKLTDLERKVGTPVRFIGAKDLAELRDRIAGPVPPRPLRDSAIGAASRILNDQYVTAVVDAVRKTHEAHTKFVDALLTQR